MLCDHTLSPHASLLLPSSLCHYCILHGLTLSTPITHPSNPLSMLTLLPLFFSFFPACSPPSPPLSHTSPPSYPPFLRINGPRAGSGSVVSCAQTSVYSDNRDWAHAVWLPSDIHRDFIKSILKTRVT